MSEVRLWSVFRRDDGEVLPIVPTLGKQKRKKEPRTKNTHNESNVMRVFKADS